MMSKSVSNVIIEPKTAFPLLWASHLIWMLSFIFSKLVVVWELNRVLAFLAACQPLFLIKKNTMNLFLQLFNLCTCMTNSRHVFGRCLSWTNVNLPSLCFELIHTSSGFQDEKSKGGVKENPASLFNRAICLKTCKIQINLLYELCSEFDSAILLNWWFYRTRRNSFFGRWPEVCRCSKSVSRSKVFSLFRLSSLPGVLKKLL